MSSTNKTEHLQLNQWVGTDPFRMADFNEDNQKIDAAFAAFGAALDGTAQIITGYFSGNGAASQFIDLGKTPKAVITWQGGTLQVDKSGWVMGGVAVTGQNSSVLALAEGGFYAKQNAASYIFGNNNGVNYTYIAIL